MGRIKDQYTCLPSSEPPSGGFPPLSLERIVSDPRVTGLGSCWHLKAGKRREKEKLVKGSKWPQSPSPLTVDPFVFLCLAMGISAPPQMLSPFLPCRPLLFASQWIYSPPYLILIKAPFSLPPQHNQLKKNELVSHCFYHFGSKRMLCLARSAPSQKMNQQLLWQKLFPEWGNRDKKKTGQGEVSVVGIASPPPPRGTSLPFTGEGSPAAGGASPSAPSMAAGPGGAILWAVLAGGCLPAAVPGGGSGRTRCPGTLVGSWWFRESKSDPNPCRSSWKPRFSQAGGGAFMQAQRSRNTYLSRDCTMAWFALYPSTGKGWIISLCLDGLGPVFSCFKR